MLEENVYTKFVFFMITAKTFESQNSTAKCLSPKRWRIAKSNDLFSALKAKQQKKCNETEIESILCKLYYPAQSVFFKQNTEILNQQVRKAVQVFIETNTKSDAWQM